VKRTLAWSLLCRPQRVIVIRAAFLLTLALTLGAGETATRLCRTFCDRTAPAEDADACPHNQSTNQLTLTTEVDCAGVGLPPGVVIRDETNRATRAAPDKATAVSHSNEPPVAALGRAFAAAASCLHADNRPRAVALRI